MGFCIRDTVIGIQCVHCGKIFEIVVNSLDFEIWDNGELIQNAFPYLSSDERELLVSGICGSCFEKIMKL